MPRLLTLLLGLGLVPIARADDTIPPGTVAAIKQATVYIRAEGKSWKGTGSGFVVRAENGALLVATNHHVIASSADHGADFTPAELDASFRAVEVTAIFGGGTKDEVAAKAEVIAADPVNDLAVLRVAGVASMPTPIGFADASKFVETTPVFMFGYPFGQNLAVGKRSPAVTVGRGAISSLRLDDDGQLTLIQIDGALNPGNSGGPIVDAAGKLVGVAVSIIKNGQGIGFAVPVPHLARLMEGRLDVGIHAAAIHGKKGKLAVRVEVGVRDPESLIRGATLHYLVVPRKDGKPKPVTTIADAQGAKSVPLAIAGGLATAELTIDAGRRDLYVQAVPDGGAGDGSTPIRDFSLDVPKDLNAPFVLGPAGSDPPGPGAGEVAPPPGWSEYYAPDRSFAAWIPGNATRRSERSRSLVKNDLRLKVVTLLVEMPGSPNFSVERVVVERTAGPVDRAALAAAAKSLALEGIMHNDELRESGARMGPIFGREYLIQRPMPTPCVRVRVFLGDNGAYLLRVVGNRTQVDSNNAAVFLDSCQRGPFLRTTPVETPSPGRPNGALGPEMANGRGPRVQGGGNDPEFHDVAPAKGMLVGLEIGLGQFLNNEVVRVVRPIYRVGRKDTVGKRFGMEANRVVRLVAKPGYGVGAIRLKTGMNLDGLALTFMRVQKDGTLDPTDGYDSDWIGQRGDGAVRIGGDGAPAAGLLVRMKTNVSGLGLIFAEAQPGADVPIATIPTRIQGGGNDPEFRDVGPAGSLLVGLEVGVGRFLDNPVVRAVRPIYRVGDEESTGDWHGPEGAPQVSEVVKLVAKPGYAAGVITLKTGLGLDGLSLTYVKVNKGRLDRSGSYESEWIGGQGGGDPVALGDGSPVIGLIGRSKPDTVSGLGLLLGLPPKK